MKKVIALTALCIIDSTEAKGQLLNGVQLGAEESHQEKFEERGVEQKSIDNIDNMQKKLDDYSLLQKKVAQEREQAPQPKAVE